MPRVRFLRDRRFAVYLSLASIAVCALVSFVLGYLLPPPHPWIMSADVWSTTASAQYVSFGGLGSIYSLHPFYSALPGFLMLMAPVVALGDHLGLVTGYPFPLARAPMWLVVGPFFFVCGSTAVPAVDYLAQTLAISQRRRKMLTVMVAFVAGPTAGIFGHPEDILALGLCCVALAWLLQGRVAGAAVTLSLAVLMQTWAVLLIPILVAATPAGGRVRALFRSAALPAAVGIALLALDWPDASTVLLHEPMTGRGQHLPWWGLAGHVMTTQLGHPLEAVTGSSTRSLALVTAVLAGWYVIRRATPERIMLATAVALYARGLFETEFWPYYLAPAAVFFAISGALATRGSAKRLAVVLTGAGLLYASAPMSYNGIQYPAILALTLMIATGGLCVVGCRPDLRMSLAVPRTSLRRQAG